MGVVDGGLDSRLSGTSRRRPRAVGEAVREVGVPRVAVETRTRGEAGADLRQSVESGWDRGQRFDVPRGELAVFRAERAGLPEVSPGEAGRYIARHRAGRPWLVVAERASPEAARIIVAADQGGGHGHIRHEGWVTEDASMRRVAYLEDPAQLEPDKRRSGIDGLKAGGQAHRCGTISTRFTKSRCLCYRPRPGAGHARVRQALEQPFDPTADQGRCISDIGPARPRMVTGTAQAGGWIRQVPA